MYDTIFSHVQICKPSEFSIEYIFTNSDFIFYIQLKETNIIEFFLQRNDGVCLLQSIGWYKSPCPLAPCTTFNGKKNALFVREHEIFLLSSPSKWLHATRLAQVTNLIRAVISNVRCLFVYWLIYCCRCLTDSVYKFQEKIIQAKECCRCVEASQWFVYGNLKNYFMFIPFGCFASFLVFLAVIKIKSPTLQMKMKTKCQFEFIIAHFKQFLKLTAFAIPNYCFCHFLLFFFFLCSIHISRIIFHLFCHMKRSFFTLDRR